MLITNLDTQETVQFEKASRADVHKALNNAIFLMTNPLLNGGRRMHPDVVKQYFSNIHMYSDKGKPELVLQEFGNFYNHLRAIKETR